MPIKFAKNQLNISGAVSKQVCLLNCAVFTVCCCYSFFLNFTFLKNQYTMVEYKSALDVISKTFR